MGDPLKILVPKSNGQSSNGHEAAMADTDPLGILKKKDNTGVSPSLGIEGSLKPVEQQPKPSPKRTEEEHNSPFVRFARTLADIPEMAVRGLFGTALDQIPSEFTTEDLRMAKGSMEHMLIPGSNIRESGFEPSVINGKLKDEYAQWNNKQSSDIRFMPDEKKAEVFLKQKFGPEYETKKSQFNKELVDYRIGLEKEIQQQNKEYADKIKGIPQDITEVNLGNVGKFIGNLAGQGLGRIPTSFATLGASSFIAERAAVFNNQLDKLATKTGLTREQIIQKGLDDPEAGRMMADFLALTDIASIGNIVGGTGKSIGKKALGVVGEMMQEGFQGEGEEIGGSMGTHGANRVPYKPSASRFITNSIGGGVGAIAVSTFLPGEKAAGGTTAPQKTTEGKIDEETQKVETPQDAEKAAESIEVKITQPNIPENIPTDLQEKGLTAANMVEAERAMENNRAFGFDEATQTPHEIHDVSELRNFTADQLLFYPRSETQTQPKEGEQNDRTSGTRLPGEVRERQEPEQTRNEQGGSREETQTNRVVQKPSEEEVAPEGFVSYEEATKIKPTTKFENLPQGQDEGSMEARSQMVRDQEKTQPEFKQYPIGTLAVDKYGEVHQLQEKSFDELVTKDEGTQRPETVQKYADWLDEGHAMPPVKGVENIDVHKGKVVITDGAHRILAAKKAGLKSVPVWVALTDRENTARPVKIQDWEQKKKYFQPKEKQGPTLAAQELQKQVDQAEIEFATAASAYADKAKELDKTLIADQENLFGERKSSGGLFDEVRANPAEREKTLAPFKARADKAKQNLIDLRNKLKAEEGKTEANLFTEETKKEEPKKQKNIPEEVGQIATAYHNEVKNPTIDPKERAIADVIKKVTPRSVKRWGDKNVMTKNMARAYVNKTGQDIDQVAKQASEALGREVTPDDVWAFMQKYPNGPGSIYTPAGNPKLAALNQKHIELTGKGLNRKGAETLSKNFVGQAGTREEANAELSEDLSPETVISEIEKDPEAYQLKWGLSDEELRFHLNNLYEARERQSGSTRGDDSRINQQGTRESRQGGALQEEFGDSSQSPEERVQEIISLPLTHVRGLNMGSGIAKGTYVSTEDQNRYEGEQKAEPATVSIEKPFVFKSENDIIPLRNKVLNDNIKEFTPADFEENATPFADNYTIDDLSPAGIEKLAGLVRDALQNEGFDSIYFEATESQEGEVIVFDRDRVKIGNEATESTQGTTSQGPPTTEPPTGPPVSEGPNEPGSGEYGKRETIVKLEEESKLPNKLKEAITPLEDYEKRKREMSQSQARRTIDRLGEEKALADGLTWKLGRSQEQKIAVLSELAERFSDRFREAAKNGNEKEANANYDKFMTAMRALSETITDTAQALSYLNLVGAMFETKAGAVRFATQQIEESRQKQLENHQNLILDAKRILEEFDKLPKDELVKSKVVQDLMDQIKKAKNPKVRAAEAEVSTAAERLKKAWANLNKQGIVWDPKSVAKDQVEFQKALIGYIKSLIKELLVKTGQAINELSGEVSAGVKEFVKDSGIQANETDLDNLVKTQIDQAVEEQLDKKYFPTPRPKKQGTKAPSFKANLRTAVKDYLTNGNKQAYDDLLQTLIDSEGLTENQAKTFAEKFKKLFDEYAQKEKERLVKKYTPKGASQKTQKATKQFFDKVIELSNAGVLSDQAMEDQVAQIFGLPRMTPEIVDKINNLVDDIKKAPGGRFKNIAITKLTDYIAQQQRFAVSDYITSSFKAGIFSGIDTQILNNTGNAFNAVELGFILGLTNPKAAARFYGTLLSPRNLKRSGLEALELLKTGFDPRFAADNRRILENRPRSFFGLGKPLKGATQALDPTMEQQKKYVFRLMSAGDMFAQQGINEALQQLLYRRQASEQELFGAEARKYVREQMGYTPQKIQSALTQAQQEAAQGRIPSDDRSIQLRAYEIIEQQRDPNIVAKARTYAAEQVMTSSPTGFVGTFARNINRLIHDIPALNAVIPVVNFAANAMNRGIQYNPALAVVRDMAHLINEMAQGNNLSTAMKNPGHIWSSFVKGNNSIEDEMRLRRFVLGTLATVTLMALTDEDKDGENIISRLLGKKIKIHGFGPGTQYNRQKTYQKQESGWIPYSVQIGDTFISYRNYPALNVLLATLGEYNDAKRYHKLSEKEAGMRLMFAFSLGLRVVSEMGFLSNMNTLLTSVIEGDPKKAVDTATRTGSGFLVPKIQRNVINLFDKNVYSSNNIQELLTRSVPVVSSQANAPLVNALGEPIQKQWWDRVELWKSHGYSKYEPLWRTNSDKNYYFPVPNKQSLDELFGRKLTSQEYNDFFKYRGEEIIKNWKPEMAKLGTKEYQAEMDKITDYAKYRALVKMGAAESDVIKDINFQLRHLRELDKFGTELKKQIKP